MAARAAVNRRCQLFVRMLFAMAFVIAQSGAEAHAYSHLVQEQPGTPSTTLGCDECLSCAPLLAGAGGLQAVVLLPPWDGHAVLNAPSVPVTGVSRPSSFQSRAPPILL
jgi:hypothetical protein